MMCAIERRFLAGCGSELAYPRVAMHYTQSHASEWMHFFDDALPRFAKRHGLIIAMVLVLVDLALLWSAFWTAYEFRYGFELGGTIFAWDLQPFSAFYGRAALFTGFCLVSFLMRGVYRLPNWTSLLDESAAIAGAVTVAMGGVILTNYLSQFNPSRLVFVYAWVLSIGYLVAFRMAMRMARRALWHRSIGVERVLVVGSGDAGRRIAQAMMASPDSGLRIAGFVDRPSAGRSLTIGTEHGVVASHRLGTIADLPAIINRHRIDQVIIALGGEQSAEVLIAANHCRNSAIPFQIVPDLLQLSFDRAELTELAGVPLLGVRQTAIVGVSAAIKRAFDLLVGLLLLVPFALAVAGALLVARTRERRVSPGRTRKIGRNGVPFDQYKLRVQEGASNTAPSSASGSTGPFWPLVAGAPLLINVLLGSMSLVGPRAAAESEVDQYESWHWQRLRGTPGLTGLWAVQGRNDMTFEEMVRLDLFYAEHWSPWLDLKVLIRSAPLIWRRPGVD